MYILQQSTHPNKFLQTTIYIGFYSTYTGKKISSIINKYCKDLNVKLLYSLHSNLATCWVLKILFPSLLNHVLCTSLHVQAVELVILVKPIGIFTHMLINEHPFRDKNSHVFKHLNCCRYCWDSCDAYSFKIIDFPKTCSQLKIKESFILDG